MLYMSYDNNNNNHNGIRSAALSKIRCAAGTSFNVELTKRCAFRRRAKVAVDSVDRMQFSW